jgi:DNA repair protein RecO
MNTSKDLAIVLSRVDYGERDRILTLLTRTHGKVSVLAKGVRSQKSRLAGGIELLSEAEVSFIEGRTNLKPLTGARLKTYFKEIVKDMRSMQLAFDAIKAVNKITEEGTGQEYYPFLLGSFAALNNPAYDPRVVEIWFSLHILRLSGSAPNLRLDSETETKEFEFDYDHQQFIPREGGNFTKNDLKLLRLCITQPKPPKIQNQLGSEDRLQTLARTLLKSNVTDV